MKAVLIVGVVAETTAAEIAVETTETVAVEIDASFESSGSRLVEVNLRSKSIS